MYGSERTRWAKNTYNAPIETFDLHLSALREVPSKPKGVLIGVSVHFHSYSIAAY